MAPVTRSMKRNAVALDSAVKMLATPKQAKMSSIPSSACATTLELGQSPAVKTPDDPVRRMHALTMQTSEQPPAIDDRANATPSKGDRQPTRIGTTYKLDMVAVTANAYIEQARFDGVDISANDIKLAIAAAGGNSISLCWNPRVALVAGCCGDSICRGAGHATPDQADCGCSHWLC